MDPLNVALKNTTSFYCGKVPHILTTQLQLRADEHAAAQLSQPKVELGEKVDILAAVENDNEETPVGKIPDEL